MVARTPGRVASARNQKKRPRQRTKETAGSRAPKAYCSNCKGRIRTADPNGAQQCSKAGKKSKRCPNDKGQFKEEWMMHKPKRKRRKPNPVEVTGSLHLLVLVHFSALSLSSLFISSLSDTG
jgi:hypothetical protein